MLRKIFVLLSVTLLFGTLKAAIIPPAASVEAAAAEATPELNGRIVGGHETNIAKYPYQVSVRLDTYILLHICGGSIYAPRIVLTAAHCIKGRYASYIRIVAGKSTIADEAEQGVHVSKLIYHKGYNKKTHENDVGLIILAEDLIYSSAIQPIALVNSAPNAGTGAIVTGWGKSDEDAETLVSNLQAVIVHVIDKEQCNSNYMERNYAITEQMICAGVDEGGKDACQGDSGGPLATADGKLLGVVSWGIGCAKSDFPGVYASAVYHREWIEENAKAYL